MGRPATGGRTRVRVSVGVIGRLRAWAEGVTWTLVTASAPWGGRYGHTSVIDAAGAIYVIGGDGPGSGYNATDTFYNDVWVSTDEGADRTRALTHSAGQCVCRSMCMSESLVPALRQRRDASGDR
jgi:hypothetical protein